MFTTPLNLEKDKLMSSLSEHHHHSVSVTEPSNADPNSRKPPPSSGSPLGKNEGYRATGRNMLHNIFRRHSDGLIKEDASMAGVRKVLGNRSEAENTSSSQGSTSTSLKDQPGPRRIQPHLEGEESHGSNIHEPTRREHAADVIQSTPEMIADYDMTDVSAEPSSETHLTRKDIQALFSGAPYFMLEKGKHDFYYPQVIFPWDDHDPTIQHLWDRKILPHPSFTLCTLHAHLPVPNGYVGESDTPVHLDSWKRTDAPKRATFDVGVFEVPNMLSMNGMEPGSVGFRHFLELPVADTVRFTGPGEPRSRPELQHLSTLSAPEADEILEHYSNPYSQCDDGTVHDRKTLLCDGPSAWKRIGLRDINLKTLINRLETLKELRHEILHQDKTILDTEDHHGLHRGLFTNFLYPPSRSMLLGVDNHQSVKAQIKTLTVVLATPGAWLDFSVVDWRLRIGQLLWEAPPHVDGDFLDPQKSQKPSAYPALEYKWFLIQMLLAAELLLRIDAVVRVGLVQNPRHLNVSARDVQRFDQLRTPKLNWDLVVVRRFLDSFKITFGVMPSASPSNALSRQSSHEKLSEKPRHFSFFENLARKHSFPSLSMLGSSRTCRLVPTHVEQQLQGLFLFAESIGWPRVDVIEKLLKSKLEGDGRDHNFLDICDRPVSNVLPEDYSTDVRNKSPTRLPVLLHFSRDNKCASGIGGWITRSWLSGFVIPGEVISHLLMATVLENDLEAIAKLGPLANLYGGFSYNGRSWWSKACIVGRVLSSLDGTKNCMGWLASTVLPKEVQTSKPLDNTWFEVAVCDPPTGLGKPRIKQGNKVSVESTPLGLGKLRGDEFTLPVDDSSDMRSEVDINFQTLTFSTEGMAQQGNKHITVVPESVMSFSLTSDLTEPPEMVSFPLTYNVQFVTSHECRLPLGFETHHRAACFDEDGNEQHPAPSMAYTGVHGHLSGHPLPSSYKYKFIALESLPGLQIRAAETVSDQDGFDVAINEVLVVDARGCQERETFARAWCSFVGYNAIIGRTGRTCLACCIREARAVAVKVVIRVCE